MHSSRRSATDGVLRAARKREAVPTASAAFTTARAVPRLVDQRLAQ
jgi:hypothetical protein